ncbi:hypothetical protein GCM10009525_04980 [Streptosporangium amethystogenes subsp. fukuiense]
MRTLYGGDKLRYVPIDTDIEPEEPVNGTTGQTWTDMKEPMNRDVRPTGWTGTSR